MGCAFCASTLNGKVRDLTAGEMLSEITAVERAFPHADDKKRTVTNIVMMGCGEPLDNYDNTVRFLKRAAAADGLGISPRNISLSTCGLVPKIYKLIEDAPHVTLCISLHAPNNDIRDRLMPVNRSYRMEELIPAAKHHVNLIPLNSVKERSLNGGSRAYAYKFAEWLEKRHVSATVRRELGTDIDGACGQLRSKHIGQDGLISKPEQE